MLGSLGDMFLAFYFPLFFVGWIVIFFASYVLKFRLWGLYGSFRLVLAWLMVLQTFFFLFIQFLPQEVAAFNKFFPEVNLQWLIT